MNVMRSRVYCCHRCRLIRVKTRYGWRSVLG